MSDKLDQEIGEEMRRITGAGANRRFPVMSGKVVSLDDDGTCTVQLTADAEDTPTDGILLNVIEGNTVGISLTPSVDADCVVCEVDGPGQLKQLLWASKYDKVVVTVGSSMVTVQDGLIQFNDGSKKGLVVLDDLVTKLNKLEQDLNNIKTVFLTAWTPVPNDGGAALKVAAATWAAANLTETVAADIENTAIKQG